MNVLPDAPPPPRLTLYTWVRFLLGDRNAIIAVASSQRALWLGLLMVLSAGLAREYDGAYLLREPWHVVLPLGASLATSAVLFVLVKWAAGSRGAVRMPWGSGYRTVLTFFWMTAPLAWIYAVPVERFLDPGPAVQVNLSFLAIVSIWRVILLTRAIAVWVGERFISMIWLVAFFADTVALAISWITPTPIWDIMGGIRLAPSEEVILSSKLTLWLVGVPAWVVLLAICCFLFGPRDRAWSITALPAPDGPCPSRGLWALASLLLVAGIALLPLTQPEQARAWEATARLKSGQLDDAVGYLSQFEREAFPPHWAPPPNIGYGEDEPEIMQVLAAMRREKSPKWIYDVYLEKAVSSYNQPRQAVAAAAAGDPSYLSDLTDYLERSHALEDISWTLKGSLRDAVDDANIDDALRQRIRSYLHEPVATEAPQESAAAPAAASTTKVESPDGRNAISLIGATSPQRPLQFSVTRDGRTIIEPSPVGPVLVAQGDLGRGAKVASVAHSQIDQEFELPWGKTRIVHDRCGVAKIELTSGSGVKWEIDLRAYNDGVALRYRLPEQDGVDEFEVQEEGIEFKPAGEPTAFFTGYSNFTSSHEAPFARAPVAEIPAGKLLDMPLLLVWPDGQAAAIAEAGIRGFSGMYLQRAESNKETLDARLSPLPDREGVCVTAKAPLNFPWRAVLLGDSAGKLHESNLLLCLNDPPAKELGDFSWALPGKTTFHWWNGAFEQLYKLPFTPGVQAEKHEQYIDFCAKYNISYHGVSGDGRPWYRQTKKGYYPPGPDADILTPRPELELPRILEYAKKKNIGIRLWVHWIPLDKQLEEAFTKYEQWGIKGLMVDFLNRDDQEMNEFTERMLESAARHKLHIQIHGSPKYSGEQRTYPNLFNREGVMNLEYLKWSDQVQPDHNVNVAYVRALGGPVDYHHGGFRSVSRKDFKPQRVAPIVMGTRCHHLALYMVYENPMPMVGDEPAAYEGQPGFDFLVDVPTTWDETRFVVGEPGEYIVLARRKGDAWYLGGITNWTPRELTIPLDFLSSKASTARLYVDGSMDEAQPNEVAIKELPVDATTPISVSLAPGGGFVGVIQRDQ